MSCSADDDDDDGGGGGGDRALNNYEHSVKATLPMLCNSINLGHNLSNNHNLHGYCIRHNCSDSSL
jgi:hypothetical protein